MIRKVSSSEIRQVGGPNGLAFRYAVLTCGHREILGLEKAPVPEEMECETCGDLDNWRAILEEIRHDYSPKLTYAKPVSYQPGFLGIYAASEILCHVPDIPEVQDLLPKIRPEIRDDHRVVILQGLEELLKTGKVDRFTIPLIERIAKAGKDMNYEQAVTGIRLLIRFEQPLAGELFELDWE